MRMFSKERAVSFLSSMLNISNPEERFEDNKVELLSLIVNEFQAKIPYQGMTLMSEPLSKRRVPTVEESVLDCEKGKGGLCYSMNVFLKCLLEALGYSTYHAMARAVGCPNVNHIMTIVENVVSLGDKFVVEAGNGFFTRLIALQFKAESPIYTDCFVKYKYVWEDGLLKRYHLRGERKGEPRWEVFYVTDMVPEDVSLFEAPMKLQYTDPRELLPCHTSMRAIKFPNSKAICICDMKLLIEDDSRSFQETKLKSEAEFLAAVKEHFPLLEEDAKKALTNWTPAEDVPVESFLMT